MSNDQQDVIILNPLLHYRKPDIGGNENNDIRNTTPLQIVFPTGEYGIGITAGLSNQGNDANNRRASIIMTSPPDNPTAKSDLRLIKLTFLLFAIFNYIITICMYGGSNIADPSSIDKYTNDVVSVFQKPPDTLNETQHTNFGFFLTLLAIGCISVIYESPLGISIYALSITLNFVLGMSQLPYFLYSYRYILDMIMLYIALIYRSRIMYTFLPTRIFDPRDRLQQHFPH